MHEESVITRTVRTAPGVFGPGHLGELTQAIDFALVDAVLEETRTQERRLRLLPSRVVVYFVLALALSGRCSCQAVWGKLTAGLGGLCLARPAASSLCRARRRIGAEPLRRLFETLAGPVGLPGQAGVFYRGLRTVAVDGTHLHVPDDPAITWRYPKRAGERLEFGYLVCPGATGNSNSILLCCGQPGFDCWSLNSDWGNRGSRGRFVGRGFWITARY